MYVCLRSCVPFRRQTGDSTVYRSSLSSSTSSYRGVEPLTQQTLWQLDCSRPIMHAVLFLPANEMVSAMERWLERTISPSLQETSRQPANSCRSCYESFGLQRKIWARVTYTIYTSVRSVMK